MVSMTLTQDSSRGIPFDNYQWADRVIEKHVYQQTRLYKRDAVAMSITVLYMCKMLYLNNKDAQTSLIQTATLKMCVPENNTLPRYINCQTGPVNSPKCFSVKLFLNCL